MADKFAEDPLSRHLLGLPAPKPPCHCKHSYEMHRLGPCALMRSPTEMREGSCYCDGYEPDTAEGAAAFPIAVLEQPKDE